MTLCHCGKPLHYSSPAIQATIEDMIASAGNENVKVTVMGRSWLVQRHYIALHGLSACDLPYLGFPEVEND